MVAEPGSTGIHGRGAASLQPRPVPMTSSMNIMSSRTDDMIDVAGTL